MKKLIEEALGCLDSGKLRKKRITLGFDGCADIICKVIKNNDNETANYIETITEFGQYITKMDRLSFSLELDEKFSKVGGNGAIFANAISTCGVETHAIGLYGKERIDEVFDELKRKCKLYSYHKNALAISLEFNDGKIILSPKVNMLGDVWKKVVAAVGDENLSYVFSETDMLGLVNWGELGYASLLWKCVYDFICVTQDMSRQIIVDLSDCRRRTEEDIRGIMDLLGKFSKIRYITLSLNETEALELGRHFGLLEGNDYDKLCRKLAAKINVQRLVIHCRRYCYTCENGEIYKLLTQLNNSPKLLTGGGDNFNAGYAIGSLLGLRGEVCNVYGNAMSSFYIMHGKSPDIGDMSKHLEKWHLELS
ncbi:MAG: hypothetical protein FWG07_07045 [Treponema sp.]|nr:hypothetical protein [Treponema sp.]